MGLKPTFVDLDRQRPAQPSATLRIRKDPDHMGSALELLIESLEHIGALKVFMMFLGESVKSEGFLDISFYPFAELGILSLPLGEPGHQVPAGFFDVAPIIKPAQFYYAVIADFAG